MCLPLKPYRIEREWEYAGLQCAVVQGREASFRCGYVRVPPTHPMFGKHYDQVDVDVHGGLTFCEAEPCEHADGAGWWFGFDCAHYGDMSTDPSVSSAELPEVLRITRRIFDAHPIAGEYGRYWLQHEVEAETERLAEQLAACRAVAE